MKKYLLVSLTYIMMFALSISSIQARDEIEDTSIRTCYVNERNINPCDDVLWPNEYFVFGVPYTDNGQVFRVDAIDLSTDRAYNAELDAWLPLYSLFEVDASAMYPGDQVLYVGEYFVIPNTGSGPEGSFKVTGNSGTTRIQTIMVNKWNQWEYVWLNCGPVYEFGCKPY